MFDSVLDSATTPQAVPASHFVENRGQVRNAEVLYYASVGWPHAGFAQSAVLITLWERAPSASLDSLRNERGGPAFPKQSTTILTGVLTRIEFEGSNPVLPRGRGELPHLRSYFLGNDPSAWRTQVRSFREIVYEQLYDGIDLVYRPEAEGLKYEFLVHPGADPGRIAIAFEGIEALYLDAGTLVARTALGDLRDTAPDSYQGADEVACRFVIRSPRSAGFRCEAWDASRELVIDPLLFATFLGGSVREYGEAIAVDAQGAVYVAGSTYSPDFPATPGAFDTSWESNFDAFVAKLNPSGTDLVYATYLGGQASDEVYAIAVDAMGQLYAAGGTGSPDFPTTPGSFDPTYNGSWGERNAFVVKLNETGSDLIYSTFVGGRSSASSLVVDGPGNAFVVGTTAATDFPTTPGAFDDTLSGTQDAFAAKLNVDGTALVYATLLGGSSWEIGHSLAVDLSGMAYVAGVTESTDFPATPGAFDTSHNGNEDGFVVKLNADATDLVYGTYLGGSLDSDQAQSIAVDADGEAYVAGFADSTDFPTTPGAFDTSHNGGLRDIFVVHLNAGGTDLVSGTFLGGNGYDYRPSIGLDSRARVRVVGATSSSDLSTVGAIDSTLDGVSDVFVAILSPAMSTLLYATYLGGSGWETPQSLAAGTDDSVYLVGTTNSTDFPVVANAFDTTLEGEHTAFVAGVDVSDVQVTLDTSPGGLQVEVDGLPYTAPHNFHCPPGTLVTISVPSPQGDASTRFVFAGWSDGGARSHTVTCISHATYVADFFTQRQVTVDTDPPGLGVIVDGVSFTAPFVAWWNESEPHEIGVVSPSYTSADARWIWQNWTDGGARSHTVSAGLETTVDDFPGRAVDSYPYPGGSYLAYLYSAPNRYQEVLGSALRSVTWEWTFFPPASDVDFGVFYDADCDDVYTVADNVGGTAASGGSNPEIMTLAAPAAGCYWIHAAGYEVSGTAVFDEHREVLRDNPQTYVATFSAEYLARIDTNPTGLQVIVNATTGTAPRAYWWPDGSSHNLSVPSPQTAARTRYTFSSWSDGGSQNHTVVVSRPENFTATFSTEYEITVGTSPAGLDVLVDGVSRAAPYTFWCPEGSSRTLNVTSPQGAGTTRYVFESWSDGGARSHDVMCDDGASYTARFVTEFLVTIDTSPTGLQLRVDAVPRVAPYAFWCAAGSSPTVDAVSPQGSGPSRFVFSGWSDGGAQSHSIPCDSPGGYTATFEVEYLIAVDTSPPGLAVEIDGGVQVAPLAFWCSPASSPTVSTPSPQGDETSRFTFVSWSDGGTRTHAIPCDAPSTLTASFSAEYRLTLESPHGSPTCDVADCWYEFGATATLSVTTPVPGATGTRYAFLAWTGDSTATTARASVTMDEPKAVTATWTTQHYLTIVSARGETTGEGWYEEGERAEISIAPLEMREGNARYEFAGWTGDVVATTPVASVTMDGPKSVTATWREVTSLDAYGWALLIAIAVVGVVVLIFLLRRRRRKPDPDDRSPS